MLSNLLHPTVVFWVRLSIAFCAFLIGLENHGRRSTGPPHDAVRKIEFPTLSLSLSLSFSLSLFLSFSLSLALSLTLALPPSLPL